MKACLLFLFISIGTFIYAQDLTPYEWMLGTWERQNTKAGQTSLEWWIKKSATEFIGKGISLHGTDTVFVEKLRLIVKDNAVYYIADVKQNPEPTYFKVTGSTPSGFTCENPEHDFPKKIDYALNGADLIATISGNGKAIPFLFRRKE
jgi:hypothetical protein